MNRTFFFIFDDDGGIVVFVVVVVAVASTLSETISALLGVAMLCCFPKVYATTVVVAL